MKGCRPLTDEEVRQVLASFSGRYAARDRAMFILGVKSGFRISEILSLRLQDAVQSGRMVDRLAVQRRNMKKKTEGRAVLLHPDAKAALSTWIIELHRSGRTTGNLYLFQSTKGGNQPISRIQAWRILRQAFNANRIAGKLGTHSMRKTFANKMHRALDGDLIRTQKALGHRNINSTVQYLSFNEEDIDQALLSI
jgi:integrase